MRELDGYCWNCAGMHRAAYHFLQVAISGVKARIES
jgi:hypothetical protein